MRCAGVTPALQAADLLARDANFGLVVLDLRQVGAHELRRIPPTNWYRLQRAVEPGAIALVVITPLAAVSSAQVRFELTRSFTMAAFERERERLVEELAPVVQRQRRHGLAEASGG